MKFGEYCANIYREFIAGSERIGTLPSFVLMLLFIFAVGGSAVGLVKLSQHEAPPIAAVQEEPEILAVPVELAEPEYNEERLDNPQIASAYVPRKGTWLLVEKGDSKVTLFQDNKDVKSWKAAPIEQGEKKRKGDMKTPNGIFTIQQIQDARSWTNGDVGPWFIRLRTPQWTGIGIHGMRNDEAAPPRNYEGSIRLDNKDLEELKNLVKPGMTVEILE